MLFFVLFFVFLFFDVVVWDFREGERGVLCIVLQCDDLVAFRHGGEVVLTLFLCGFGGHAAKYGHGMS